MWFIFGLYLTMWLSLSYVPKVLIRFPSTHKYIWRTLQVYRIHLIHFTCPPIIIKAQKSVVFACCDTQKPFQGVSHSMPSHRLYLLSLLILVASMTLEIDKNLFGNPHSIEHSAYNESETISGDLIHFASIRKWVREWLLKRKQMTRRIVCQSNEKRTAMVPCYY